MIIQEAKAITAEFKEIEAEYNSPDSLIDTGNWYYISKKQDEVISRLLDMRKWKPIESAPKAIPKKIFPVLVTSMPFDDCHL